MGLRRALPLIFAVLVGACEPPLVVELASGEERLPTPAFTIREPSQPGEAPRYDALHVVDEAGAQVWAVRVLPTAEPLGAARVVYGEAPAGFDTVRPALPLVRGRTYRLTAVGEGRGALRFQVGENGQLQPAP